MNYEEFKKEIERISYLSIKNIEGNGGIHLFLFRRKCAYSNIHFRYKLC